MSQSGESSVPASVPVPVPVPGRPPGPSPAERVSTPVDGVEVLGALSPSRAGDFVRCPLLYRFRSVDRLPEEPSTDALRGTLVHRVLEDLFDLPAARRTPSSALELVPPAWAGLLESEPGVADLFVGDATPDLGEWLASCGDLVRRWFTLEDPTRLEPAEREVYVEALLDSRLLLRGFVDRVDVAPDGAVRIVDYKTGRSPREGFEASALFQLRFYALVLLRTRGVVPAQLQLVYLGDGQVVRYAPDLDDLLATERKVQAIWEAISAAREARDWQPSPGRHCDWCSHRALCPAWGGTPPPVPVES